MPSSSNNIAILTQQQALDLVKSLKPDDSLSDENAELARKILHHVDENTTPQQRSPFLQQKEIVEHLLHVVNAFCSKIVPSGKTKRFYCLVARILLRLLESSSDLLHLLLTKEASENLLSACFHDRSNRFSADQINGQPSFFVVSIILLPLKMCSTDEASASCEELYINKNLADTIEFILSRQRDRSQLRELCTSLHSLLTVSNSTTSISNKLTSLLKEIPPPTLASAFQNAIVFAQPDDDCPVMKLARVLLDEQQMSTIELFPQQQEEALKLVKSIPIPSKNSDFSQNFLMTEGLSKVKTKMRNFSDRAPFFQTEVTQHLLQVLKEMKLDANHRNDASNLLETIHSLVQEHPASRDLLLDSNNAELFFKPLEAEHDELRVAHVIFSIMFTAMAGCSDDDEEMYIALSIDCDHVVVKE